MSFGFSISDFIAVGELAFKLYHDCYKIARGAPHEVQLLTDEMKTLSSSLVILQAEAQDPDSILVQAGHDRVRLVNDIVHGIGDTLRKLEKFAAKYGILVSSSKRKHLWTKLKWSMELSRIDALRSKLIYHNTCMNLLLTCVGNSSLQRLESSNRALEQGIKDVKSIMYANKAQLQDIAPSISAINDDVDGAFLSAEFLKNAEVVQPWRTINLDQWIEAGRWWLIRAQMAFHTISGQNESSSIAAYTDLMKASWILVDIIACHPQTPFAATTAIAEVRTLSAQIEKLFAELSAMNLSIPGWSEFNGQNFQIWESSTKTSTLRPRRSVTTPGEWIVEGGEQVLFQQFTLYKSKMYGEIQPCILLLLVQEDASGARLVALNQNASIAKELSFNENVLQQDVVSGPVDEITYDSSEPVSPAEESAYYEERELSMDPKSICFKKNRDLVDSAKFEPFEDTELTFSTAHDARLLKCVLSGINAYLHRRQKKHNNIEDLKAFVLLTAIQEGSKDTVATLLQTSRVDVSRLGQEDDLPIIAQTLASQYMKGGLNERKLEESDIFEGRPSIFSWAIQHGHLSLVARLVDEKLPVVEGGYLPPLALAAYCGHTSITQMLISRGFDVRETIRSPSHWDATALHLAAGQGYKEIVLLLLENDADVNAKTDSGRTALMFAACCRAEATMWLLMSRGAHILEADDGGIDTTHYAMATSESMVSTVLNKACALNRGASSPCLPIREPRRASIVFEVESERSYSVKGEIMGEHKAKLWLDSHHAYIEPSADWPRGLHKQHRKAIVISCQKDMTDLANTSVTEVFGSKCITFSIKFNVIHQERVLDFTVEYEGSVRLQVHNGGFRDSTFPRKASFHRRSLFFPEATVKWKGVELDPNAEIIKDLPQSDASHYAVCGDPNAPPLLD